jgi:hypothetical protein
MHPPVCPTSAGCAPITLALALLLAGCATTATAPASAPGGAPGAAAPAAAPDPAASGIRPPGAAPSAATPGQPQPFVAVAKDAVRVEGLFPLWQKDEKVWLELKPEDFGRPFFLSPKIARGIGEAGLFGGTMIGRWGRTGRAQIVEFRRVHNQVQLIARNNDFAARAGTPEGRAVDAAFSVSLLASSTVASQPHPERKTVLVEAGPLFLGDLLGIGMQLQRSFRQGYALDARHTAFTSVRGKPDQVVFNVNAHFAAASIATAQPNAAPGTPAPTVPGVLPDARSMFFGLYYALARLPDDTMKPRAADPRVGHFSTLVQDFGDDLARSPRQRYVNRWRLEKKDPAAPLSEPVKPIVFWLDKTIPLKYRPAMTRGVLEWNKAFEKIGFRNAVAVQVQPDDADFDTLDVGVASIRWMTNSQPNFGAIGPSQVDPRSGEILDADIGFESLSSRNVRSLRAQILVPGSAAAAADWAELMQFGNAERLAQMAQQGVGCEAAGHAAEQLAYAMDVLEARGELDPASPEAERFVLEYIAGVTMHEVGHTLGLRHNFRSSRAYTLAQLADPAFTAANGIAGSVMEYPDLNLPAPGVPYERHGAPFRAALGPYDYWAIEYAYKSLPAEQEAAELKRIAARSAEPQLAYATDEDNGIGIDPEALTGDLGDDVLAFAKTRFDIARDLIQRQEKRSLRPDEDYGVLRRSLRYAVRDVGSAAGVLARQIGGLRTLRDFPGSGRDPLQPVPAGLQRAALELLAEGVLSADSLRIAPALQRRLAPDFAERTDAVFAGDGPGATDYSPIAVLLDMQRVLLGQLMSDGVAARILDSEGKFDGARDAFQLAELYGRLTRAVWSELGSSGDIPAARRELQREYVNRIGAMLLRPGVLTRADARSLARTEAQALLLRLQAAGRRPGLSAQAQAHLADSADSLSQALAARLQRSGV